MNKALDRPDPGRFGGRDWPIAGGLVAVALALRLVRLHEVSLWYDEAFGLAIARLPWGAMNRAIASDVHPPLYFWLLHAWQWVGHSPVWARLFSVTWGVLGVGLLYLFCRRWVGRTVALAAAALLAVNPLHLYLSQELRMYSLLSAGVVALMWAALAAGESPIFSLRCWIALTVAAVIVLWTQYLGVAAVIGAYVGMLLVWSRRGAINGRLLAGWFASGLVAVGSVVPWLLCADWARLGKPRFMESPGQWFIKTLADLLDAAQGMVRVPPWLWVGVDAGRLVWPLLVLALLGVMAVVGLDVLWRRGRQGAALVVGSTWLVGLAALVAYQLVGLPFYSRFYIILLAPVVVLWAAALVEGLRVWRWAAALVVVAAFLSNDAATLRTETREVTCDLMRLVEAHGGPDRIPPVVFDNIFLFLPVQVEEPRGRYYLLLADGDLTPAQRIIIPSGRLLRAGESLPATRFWLVISRWGAPPPGAGQILKQARRIAQTLGLGEAGLEPLARLSIPGGVKWAWVVQGVPR